MVKGVDAVAKPVPPVAAVYQSRLVPVAVKGTAALFSQYGAGVVTAGFAGVGLTVTVIKLLELAQPETLCVT